MDGHYCNYQAGQARLACSTRRQRNQRMECLLLICWNQPRRNRRTTMDAFAAMARIRLLLFSCLSPRKKIDLGHWRLAELLWV